MRPLILFAFIIPLFWSCDPLVQMEANIENTTSKSLSVDFVSWDTSRSKTLLIDPNQTVRFEVYDGYGTYVEPDLNYDSVLIKNQADEILKVYKPDDTGKNIYNVDDYWSASEPSKRFFKYTYEIEREDIE